ncbi:pentapeptide repeat-containing protein [Alkalinema pantanalense CENA528]|uniref:pentapeptide repeat-containing protein n=1 Tax=Alkalinema pantanalense TaxID=1620705 RepID=UPI003D6F1CB1
MAIESLRRSWSNPFGTAIGHGLRRFWGWGICLLVLLAGFGLNGSPAQGLDYPPPLSYSNADLKGQDFSGQVLRTAEFSNANLEDVNFSQADLRGVVLSASVLTGTNLHAANLANALMDQVKFKQTDLSDAILTEAILLHSTFEAIDITGADFTDAILDGAQIKTLCKIATGINSATGVETRDSLGCFGE